MIILWQVLLGISFLFIIFFTVVLPGVAVIKKLNLKLDDLEQFSIAAVLGMVLFTLSAYILAWLNLRILMHVFPLLGILSFLRYKKNILKFKLGVKHTKLFLFVLILGIIGQVAVNAPSGLPYKDGIYFWSSHGHDGVWHLALMEQMHRNQFPFQNPELAGAKLQNYHFFVDLFMSEVTRIFPFSNLDVYFRFMPTFFSLLLGLGGFIFVRLWNKSEISGIWSMIFIYFCGSFGYFLTIPRAHNLGGESIFWVTQTQSILGNPPHASAFIIVTAFLFCLFKYLEKFEKSYFFILTILGGAVIEFKVYAGALILVGLLCIGLWQLLMRKGFSLLLLFFSTSFIAAIVYLPNTNNSQGFLLWQPWWYIRTMVVAPDRLDWLDLELRRQTYVSESNWKRVIQLEVEAFLIFLIGNLGMRFIGFWTAVMQIKQNIFKNVFNLFFLIITITAFFVPVFFLQKGVAWNTIQFNQYFLLLMGFLAAITISNFLEKKKLHFQIILAALVIILSLPTQLGLMWQFYSNIPLSKVSNSELEALNFLKKESSEKSIILTAPFSKDESQKYSPPVPIYSWYDTGYVAAFSSRATLISDQEQIGITGYKADKLFAEREDIFKSSDPVNINNFLKKYNINFIYLAWDQHFAVENAKLKADLIFQNKDARIYKVRN